MTQEKMSPLRQRMIEDMRIRGMGDKHQKSHIRAIKDFAAFLGRSPDTATPEDLGAYQLHMTGAGVTPSTFNTRIVALRFFFGMTCEREEMKRYMQFRTEPRKLPVVFSVEEVSDILMAAPWPGLKYRAAEVCNLKVGDIDSDRMLIHVELGKGQKDRKVMSAIEACRTEALGGHVAGCTKCGHHHVSYNSCKNRHCPKCQGPAARDWMEARAEDLLPVEYFHVVFTLPAEIAQIAFWNKKAVYGLLFKASAETVRTIAADPKRMGARVLHT